MTSLTAQENEQIELLLRLTLNPNATEECLAAVQSMGSTGRQQWLRLAQAHHVVIRSFQPLLACRGQSGELTDWLESALASEELRIANAVHFLALICADLEAAGCPTVVIKSLDHWPDMGSDLDLYTTAEEEQVKRVMTGKFRAWVQKPSWGDRLAHKLNFAVPGLRELVEIHVGRLGQTGEYTGMARRFISRRVLLSRAGRLFFVPAPEERLIAATLQRMYRHFYARVCDFVDTAQLVKSNLLDYQELRHTSENAGIWPGVATFLVIVSNFAFQFGGQRLDLPSLVTEAARFDSRAVRPRNSFLRVPIWPQAAELYASQLRRCFLAGEPAAALRLSLLPGLASAALIAARVTGSDKGVW
jgi:hypothetical protein